MVDSDCKVPWSCSCKASPYRQPSTTVLNIWYEVFVLICCVCFYTNVVLCIKTKHLYFSHCLSQGKSLSPATLLNKLYLFCLFLILLSWTFTYNMLTEACRVWDVTLGIFSSISEHCTVWPWGELARTPTTGKTYNFLNVFHLWIIFLS